MQEIILPSPLDSLAIPNDQGIRFFMKRDDLIHSTVSGNKWRKLKYQIQDCQREGYAGVLTFGGAFSNHIVATAAACQMKNLKSVGIIRGEPTAAENPSLSMAQSLGMALHFVSRGDYKLKEDSSVISSILASHADCAVVNEGGSHQRALRGVGEVIAELADQSVDDVDYLICAVGTGTTFAGLTQGFTGELLGVNVLKNAAVEKEICDLLAIETLSDRHKLLQHYHRGGYAKFDEVLIESMIQFYKSYGIKTDLVYTAKLMLAVQDLLDKQYFKKDATVVIYHSGGLQGNAGMNYRFPGLIQFDL